MAYGPSGRPVCVYLELHRDRYIRSLGDLDRALTSDPRWRQGEAGHVTILKRRQRKAEDVASKTPNPEQLQFSEVILQN